MGWGAAWIAAIALTAAPPTSWDGTNPFKCQLQDAGYGTTVPHPDADPYCVEFDKRRQNITDLGIVDFLSKEPARVAAAVDKCFYFQSDHWRASVIQDDGSTKLYEWDGHYFFDKARGDGGAWVSNFNVNGQPADTDFRTGGVITHDDIPADPSCAGRDPYAHPAPASAAPPPMAPCADARGPVTRRSIGPLRLGMTEARAREILGAPRTAKRHVRRWCVDGGGYLEATLGSDPNVVRLRTNSPIYRFHGIHPGSRVRWRAGTHRIGRNLIVGARGHRVRWLACARAS
jgi:hypothetical protein